MRFYRVVKWASVGLPDRWVVTSPSLREDGTDDVIEMFPTRGAAKAYVGDVTARQLAS